MIKRKIGLFVLVIAAFSLGLGMPSLVSSVEGKPQTTTSTETVWYNEEIPLIWPEGDNGYLESEVYDAIGKSQLHILIAWNYVDGMAQGGVVMFRVYAPLWKSSQGSEFIPVFVSLDELQTGGSNKGTDSIIIDVPSSHFYFYVLGDAPLTQVSLSFYLT